MKTTKQDAQAKAVLHALALEACAQRQISAGAQALISTLIAVSWPKGNRWSANIGVELLASRLCVKRHTIRRWAVELERSQLITRRIGRCGRLTRWSIARILEGRCAGAPTSVRQRSLPGAPALPRTVRQRSAEAECSITSGLAQSQPANGSLDEPAAEDRTSPDLRESLPRLSRLQTDMFPESERTRRAVRAQAAAGCPDSHRLLELMHEIQAVAEVPV